MLRVRQHYRSMRTEEAFEAIYQAAVSTANADSEGRVSEPELPRRRKVPARLGGGEDYADADPRSLFRRHYYELLDLLDGQLGARFDQPGFLTL